MAVKLRVKKGERRVTLASVLLRTSSTVQECTCVKPKPSHCGVTPRPLGEFHLAVHHTLVWGNGLCSKGQMNVLALFWRVDEANKCYNFNHGTPPHQVLVSTPVVPSPSTVQCDLLGNGKVGDCFFFRQFLLRRSRAKTRATPGQRARRCLLQTPSSIELAALP